MMLAATECSSLLRVHWWQRTAAGLCALALVLASAACGRLGFDPVASDGGGNADAGEVDGGVAVASFALVALGRFHTCARREDGSLACWGANDVAQLGDGNDPVDQMMPSSVLGLTDVVSVAAGETLSCALGADERVACWGLNDRGQIGSGTGVPHPVPEPVVGLANVVELEGGNEHACARLDDGTVSCWGRDFGAGADVDVPTPRLVDGISDAVQLTAGDGFTCARRLGGQVACWGLNPFGQLGVDGPASATPVPVTGISNAAHIAAGNNHACAALTTGRVMCWGRNRDGNLGDGTQGDSATPVLVMGVSGAVSVAAGDFFSCARVEGGGVLCWGSAVSGRLGNPDADADGDDIQFEPIPVLGLPAGPRLFVGGEHACARPANGQLWCWGRNNRGQLGGGSTAFTAVPISVVGIP